MALIIRDALTASPLVLSSSIQEKQGGLDNSLASFVFLNKKALNDDWFVERGGNENIYVPSHILNCLICQKGDSSKIPLLYTTLYY